MLGNSWKLVQQKKDGIVLDLKSNLVTFGRQQSCTFPFKSNYLSRKHAKMKYDGSQWAIMDENSMNGVFVRAHQIPANKFVALCEGDTIGFGMPICGARQSAGDYYCVFKLQRGTEEPAEQLPVTEKEISVVKLQPEAEEPAEQLPKIEKDQNNKTDKSHVIPDENNDDGLMLKRKTKHSDLLIIVSSDDEDDNEKTNPVEPKITSPSNNTVKDTEVEECKYSQVDEIIEISDSEDEDFQIKKEVEIKTKADDYDDDEEEGIRYKLRMQEQLDWNDEFNTGGSFSTTTGDVMQSEFWCPPSPEIEVIENDAVKVELNAGDNVRRTSIEEENDTGKFGIEEELRISTIGTENIITENNIAGEPGYPGESRALVCVEPVLSETRTSIEEENDTGKFGIEEELRTSTIGPETIITENNIPGEPGYPGESRALVCADPVLSETITIVESEPKQMGHGNASEGRIASELFDNGEQFFPVLSQDFEESNEFEGVGNSASVEDNDDSRLQRVKARIAHIPANDRLKQASRGQRPLHFVNPAFLRKQKAAGARTVEVSALNLCSRNKLKTQSTKDKVIKGFGHRIRAPGGGSAIPFQSDVPSTSGGCAGKNTDSKTSDKSDLFVRPEAKSCRPKVFQTRASRNEIFLQSMEPNTIGKPLLKRPATTSTSKSLPVVKKPHLLINETAPVASNNEMVKRPCLPTNEALPVKRPRLASNETSPVILNDEILPPLVKNPHSVINRLSPEVTTDESTKSKPITINQSRFHKQQALAIVNTSVNESSAIIPKVNGDNFKRPIKCAESILRNCSSSNTSLRKDPRQVCFNETTKIRMVDKYIKETGCSTGTGPVNYYKRPAFVKRKQISPFILTVLQWNTSWLQEQKQFGNLPPLVPKNCVQKVKDIYTSPEEYKKTYGSLIAYETWSEISEQKDENKNPLNLLFCLKEYKYNNSGETASTELYGYGVTERIDARQLRNGWLGTLFIYVDDNLPIVKQSSCSNLNNEKESTSNQQSKSRRIFAYAEELVLCDRTALPEDIPISLQNLLKNQNNLIFNLTIRAKSINLSSKCKEKPMRLTMISYLLNHVRSYDAVHSLDCQILGDLILNSNALNLLPKECLLKPSSHLNELNSSQKDTVLRVTEICCPKVDVPNICLVHGPPGTGKTKVITAIIRELLIQKDCHYTFLVCAPSNSAVDELTRRIIGLKKEMKEKGIGHIHLVRVNQHPNLEDEIREYTVDKYLERKINARKKAENVNPCAGSSIADRRDILKRANVITTTLGSCTRTEMDILHSKQIICIIDEATQCVEPEAILPLSYPVKKLILVGDHKQLPATVRSMHATANFYNKSLFERLFCNYSKKNSRAICSLNVQYRMHNEICIYPSTTFYDGKLLTAKNLNLRNNFPFENYHFFNVYDGQEKKMGKDIINPKECDFVYKLCQVLLEESIKNIGIITFYSAQKSYLEKRRIPLLQEKSKYVEINTVDAFQGREKDVIILSAVRANGNQNIGFTSSCNRINVAFTRGRYALYVLGHLNTLKSNEDWKSIIDDAGRRNKLTVVTSRFDNNMINDMLRKNAEHTS